MADPKIVPGVLTVPIVRYTDPSQIDYFRRSINQAYGTDCNVRFDPEDPSGTTIRWFHAYYLPLGDFLYEGYLAATAEQLRTYFAPLDYWPDDLTTLFETLPGESEITESTEPAGGE